MWKLTLVILQQIKLGMKPSQRSLIPKLMKSTNLFGAQNCDSQHVFRHSGHGIRIAEDKLPELNSCVLRLMKKTDQLENQSQLNIAGIVNLQEGGEGTDLAQFLMDWIHSVLGKEHFVKPMIIE